jgi:hypothetical protein
MTASPIIPARAITSQPVDVAELKARHLAEAQPEPRQQGQEKAERRLLIFVAAQAEIPYLRVDPDSRRRGAPSKYFGMGRRSTFGR